MRKIFARVLLSALAAFFIVLSAGCPEQNQLSPRKYKLLADENYRLAEKLNRLQTKLDNQVKLLQDCQAKQAALEASAKAAENLPPETIAPKSSETADEIDFLSTIMNMLVNCENENTKLKEEIENLKAKTKTPQEQPVEPNESAQETQPPRN